MGGESSSSVWQRPAGTCACDSRSRQRDL